MLKRHEKKAIYGPTIISQRPRRSKLKRSNQNDEHQHNVEQHRLVRESCHFGSSSEPLRKVFGDGKWARFDLICLCYECRKKARRRRIYKHLIYCWSGCMAWPGLRIGLKIDLVRVHGLKVDNSSIYILNESKTRNLNAKL